MKLTITSQFQAFMNALGISFDDILSKANIPNLLKEETLILSDLEYYRLFQQFNDVITDERANVNPKSITIRYWEKY